MQFVLNDYHRNVSDSELINDLKRVAEKLNKETITIDDYNQYGEFHATTLTRRFKSWFKCLELANLKMSRSALNISNESLFEDIERVWILLGKQPSYQDMSKHSQYSMGTYEKRFNGWRGALNAFVDYINKTNVTDNEQFLTNNINAKVTKSNRNINLRLRFLVMKRDDFKCCMCGRSPATTQGIELQVDHIIPWSKGGETTMDNLQTLCRDCNLGKSNLE